MAMVVIPSMRIRQAMERYHDESFFLDFDASGMLILYLKLFANLAISVINGAPLTIVFRNPQIEKNSITLYIHDIADAPFYISKVFHSEQGDVESKEILGLVGYVHYFEINTKMRIAIFDETLKNIFTADTEFQVPPISLSMWYQKVRTDSTRPDFNYENPQENESTGYIIQIQPLKCSDSFLYRNVKTTEEWGEKPYVISTNKEGEYYEVSNYVGTGKLGYLQEQNLREILSVFYTPNVQLFASPRLNNGLELIDFAFGTNGHLVLIESKATASYDGEDTRAKTKEKSLTILISKACKQLKNAERIVTETPLEVSHAGLFEHCIHAEHIVKVCLVNDTTLINSRSLSDSLKISSTGLSVIMSVGTFYEILLKLQDPAKIVRTLFDIKIFLDEQHNLPILAGISN